MPRVLRNRKRYVWSDALVRRLKELWPRVDMSQRDIAEALGMSTTLLLRKVDELGLGRRGLGGRPATVAAPLKRTAGEIREEHRRVVTDVVRRRGIKQPPVTEVSGFGSLFGSPIKQIEPDTQRLIDEALAKRVANG